MKYKEINGNSEGNFPELSNQFLLNQMTLKTSTWTSPTLPCESNYKTKHLWFMDFFSLLEKYLIFFNEIKKLNIFFDATEIPR